MGMNSDRMLVDSFEQRPSVTEAPVLPVLSLRLFGPLEITVLGLPLPRLRFRRSSWLLALLALQAGRELERGFLAGLFWPESSDKSALVNLRSCLYDLRCALGEAAGLLCAPRPRTLALDPSGLACDVLAFDAAIRRNAPASLEEAVALYRGPLLEGCTETWAVPERNPREHAFLSALETLSAQAMRVGEMTTAERYLRRAIVTHPLWETAHRALMEVLAAAGNHAAALVVYRELRALLHREVNLGPDEETQALFRRLQAEATAGSSPARRQLAARWDGAPPSKTPADEPSHNLPAPITRFIGRERAIAELQRLLITTRLLTITGAGGCGKSRLAVEALRDLVVDMPDGVWLVELASLADPDLVPQAVATAIGVQERSGQPLPDTLSHWLRSKRLLLVLDNCEHLAPACAALADRLLRGCADVRLLTTSREPLRIAGETLYRIPPLSLPGEEESLAAIRQSEAVLLFIDRAMAVEPAFALTEANGAAIGRICVRLDGIPLAIELAAARITALPLETLAERLEHRFRLLDNGSRTAMPRHRTLRAMIDCSHDLLSEPERILLRRLSVFAGGWTLEAAEAVCGDTGTQNSECGTGSISDRCPVLCAGLPTNEVLSTLTLLVGRSLVQYENRDGEGRYRLLETLREYAQERLREADEREELGRWHHRYFLVLAERAYASFHTAQQRCWFERLETEHDNLRAALDWLRERGAREPGLQLAGALGPFWAHRGYLTEACQRLEELLGPARTAAAAPSPLALPPERSTEGGAESVPPRSVRATAMFWAGYIGRLLGHHAQAGHWFERGLEAARADDDRRAVGLCLNWLGNEAFMAGDTTRGRALTEEALAVARETGDRRLMGRILHDFGTSLLQVDPEKARSLLSEALLLARECGADSVAAIVSLKLGTLAGQKGDFEEMRARSEEALALARAAGSLRHIAMGSLDLGLALRALGHGAAARCYLEEAYSHSEKSGHSDSLALALIRLADVDRDEGEPVAARLRYWEALRLCRETGRRLWCLYPMPGLAAIAQHEGDPVRAARLFGAVEALREAMHVPFPPSEAAEFAPHMAAVRACLGEAAFAAAWAEGRVLSLDETVAYALEVSDG
jgi:predicted ATPase/DNA-binding SARP family transcriptional activator